MKRKNHTTRRRVLMAGSIASVGFIGSAGGMELKLDQDLAQNLMDTPDRAGDDYIQSTILYLSHPDAPKITANPDYQYVLTDVAVPGDINGENPPEPKDFTLHLDSDTFDGRSSLDGADILQITLLKGAKSKESEKLPSYIPDQARGFLGFKVPADVNTSNAHITVEKGDKTSQVRQLSGEAIDKLNNSVEFSVETWDMPSKIKRGESYEMTIQVRNTGERQSQFRGTVGPTNTDHIAGFYTSVPNDSTESIVLSFSYPPRGAPDAEENANEVAYELNWGTNSLVKNVEISE